MIYKIKVKGLQYGEVKRIIHKYETIAVYEDEDELITNLDNQGFGEDMRLEYEFDIILDYELYKPKTRNKKLTLQELLDILVQEKSLDKVTLSEFNKAYPLFQPYVSKLPADQQFKIVSEAVGYAWKMVGEKSKALMPKVYKEKPFKLPLQRKNKHENYYGKKLDFSNFDSTDLKTVFKGKRILFIENDESLSYQIGSFYQWVLSENIEHYIIFNAGKTPLDVIAKKIHEYDTIAYMSQYVRETTHKLIEYVKELKEPKTILECYISEPHFYYLPENVVHDMYILTTKDDNFDKWEFYKLDKTIPYWEFKKGYMH